MRVLKVGLAVLFMAAATLTVTSVSEFGAAEAKSHVKKGKPGKCGTLMYYSKKDKGCVSKA